ncbi:hypothetical protein BP6252_13040 [Coleophoma cylindrospora]|uniref:Integral membrane protein n=1 Tax=Coleophoma cylindrospora TaxID=1849047 RepID=A0A3D8QDN0_9HELO|nr:hypothetical protein BP6252_13040 [Coleophoma cylindrospora]
MGVLTADDFLRESCIWYAISILVVITRITTQVLRQKSWRNLCADDWLMLLVTIAYTGVLIGLNHLTRYEHILPQNDTDLNVDHPIEQQILISKICIATEMCMLTTLWGIKACLLILYNKITKLLLIGIFGLGLLTIVAATMTRYYNFANPLSISEALPWYFRECSTAMLASNLVLCRPAFMAFINRFRKSRTGKGTPESTEYTFSSHSRQLSNKAGIDCQSDFESTRDSIP